MVRGISPSSRSHMSTLPTKSYPFEQKVILFMMTRCMHLAEIKADVEWADPAKFSGDSNEAK
jgi:hypothetical protein